MLVLSRKQGEEILIGENVCIKVLGVFGNKIRLGISAPTQVAIRRAEIDFFGKTIDRTSDGEHRQTTDFNTSTPADYLLEHA